MDEWIRSIDRLVKFIDENAYRIPSLSEISSHVGYSPCYCSEQFHRLTGLTVREYMAKRRLYLAALALIDTDKPIIDIALEHGFSSQQALTRAMRNAYGCTPLTFRRNPMVITPVNIAVTPSFKPYRKGDIIMSRLVPPSYRFEYIPAHRFLGVYEASKTSAGDRWPGHDCEVMTDIVQNIPVCEPTVANHTAGWIWRNGERHYFYGVGVPVDYDGEIPEGFELTDVIPQSYYIAFSHPPFDYLTDNCEVIGRVEELAWNFDPTSLGYEWNEEVCRDYQRHYPEVLGYHVLRPVKK